MITCIIETDFIVESNTLNFSVFKITDKVSIISNVINYLLNAFHAFSFSVHACYINSEVRADALNTVTFKILIDTVSTEPDENN